MQRIRLCPALQTEGQPRKRAPDHAVGLLEHGEQPKLPRLSDGDSDLQRGPERIGSLVPHAPGGGHATFRHAADDVCNSSVSAEGRPVGRTLSHDMTACIPPSPNASLGGFDGRARSRCGAHEERPLHLRSRMELLHAMQQLNESEVAIREELRVLRQGYEATMSSLKSATAMSSLDAPAADMDLVGMLRAGAAARTAGAQPRSPPSASQGPLPPRPPRATPTRQQLGHHQAPTSSTALQQEAPGRTPLPTQRQVQPHGRAPSAAHTASRQFLHQQQQELLLQQALAQVQAGQRGRQSMPPPSGGAAAQRAAVGAAGPQGSAAQVGSSAGPWHDEARSAGPAERPRLDVPAMDPAIGAALMRLLQQQAAAHMLRV